MTTPTTSQRFFEEKYLQNADPWSFASSAYEQGRYDAIVHALEYRRYERAFEPGCSVGVLTSRLAAMCDRVEAMDISPTAVEHARERCRDLGNVHITCGALPEQTPRGEFDLSVLSEIGYYFEEEQLVFVAERLIQQLAFSGVLLAVHWLGTSQDHVLSGDCVHEVLRTLSGLRLDYSERHSEFRLDRWMKA
jgi:protein-L-isoaspartate O-methyltransferase